MTTMVVPCGISVGVGDASVGVANAAVGVERMGAGVDGANVGVGSAAVGVEGIGVGMDRSRVAVKDGLGPQPTRARERVATAKSTDVKLFIVPLRQAGQSSG